MIPHIEEEASVENKAWGHEIVIHNSNKYCGKVLLVKAGHKFSMHFHVKKRESWFIFQGVCRIHWYNTESASEEYGTYKAGTIVEIYRGLPHQIQAIEDTIIFEVSTKHDDFDSYRVGKGDTQNV